VRTAAQLNHLAVSPDGRLVGTGHKDGSLRVWEVATGKERCRFGRKPTGDAFGAVAFSPDGRLVTIGAGDDLVLVYDLGTGARRLAARTGRTAGGSARSTSRRTART